MIEKTKSRKTAKELSEKIKDTGLLLANKWEGSDPTGWLMSEKLDGVRAYWDGKQVISRYGNAFTAPTFFCLNFPPFPLDGELWMDRKKFQETVSIVRTQNSDNPEWKKIKYLIFDAPTQKGGLMERMSIVKAWFETHPSEYIEIVAQIVCKDRKHLDTFLSTVEAKGGEGIMLREPSASYVHGRSNTLLKVKTFHDADGILVDYTAGKGKYEGMVGAFRIQMPNGKTFDLSGMTDAQRKNPPPIGSIITYKYQELSKDGIPRFSAFLRVRTDMTLTEYKKQCK